MPACTPAETHARNGAESAADFDEPNRIQPTSGASIESTFLRESQHDVHVLHGLTGRAFTEVVERGENVNHAVALRDLELRVVRLLDGRQNAARARR